MVVTVSVKASWLLLRVQPYRRCGDDEDGDDDDDESASNGDNTDNNRITRSLDMLLLWRKTEDDNIYL